ncbi:MAG: alpha-L-fucosidase [Tannerella sp.]|jgi:alpha-L-fucosidase|nr:alpha-L-fucosidase [Tannerella sp.]
MSCLKFNFIILATILFSCKQVEPPLPYGATPSEGQLQWHEVDFYGMICLSTITYTDQEWGYGDEPASIFNPEQFDAGQMVGVMKEAGMKGVLVVAKHHGGFCLWPTTTTDYSVKSSPWRNGQGDMIREFADAAREAGLKFGVYLSPWDRNDPAYGKPEYVERYREQLRELHTLYGDIFLSWFDGANGGDGYYGGARERREIDRSSYYDWDNTWQLVREMQPHSAIFSDIGWDVRWVGNEKGFAGEPCWATYTPEAPDGGKPGCGHCKWQEGVNGHRNGKYWIPAECDVPIRPGWFYHQSEDQYVKSPETLFDLYFMSVGRGAAFDIGLAPDKSGQLYTSDVESLRGLGRLLKETFSINLAQQAKISVNQTRGESRKFSPSNLIDLDKKTYWSTNEEVTDGEIMIELPRPTRFNIVSLREYLPLGQRIDSILVEVFDGKDWSLFAKASSVGAHRLLRGAPVETSKVRIYTWGPVCPALSEAGLYLEPKRMNVPVISRDRQGLVSVTNLNPYMSVYYTLDGSDPKVTSEKYLQPVALPDGGTLKLRAFDGSNASEIILHEFGIAKGKWESLTVQPAANRAFDENPATVWIAEGKATQELCIDIGNLTDISTFIYTPPADGTTGLVNKYELYIASRSGQWGKAVAEGEFGNIRNNPLPQTIHFEKPVNGRYIRFVAKATVDDAPMAVAEIDILKANNLQ